MTIWAHWRGLIARLDVDTTDGRRLVKGEFGAGHFVRLPVPVTAWPKPATLVAPGVEPPSFTVVGRVDRVSIRRAEGHQQQGEEVYGEGVLDLDELFRVRSDLRSTAFHVDDGDGAVHDLWPVGINVVNGEFEGNAPLGQIVCKGSWELASMAIEHDAAVWPGVGIEVLSFEDDGLIRS